MDDSDLSGLDLAGAKAYLLEVATSARMSRKALEAAGTEIELWTKRVALAEGKGLADLADAARAKLAELETKRGSLAAETAEAEATVRRIREKLPMVAAKERSIDADRLLAELQLLTGELLGEGAAGEAGLEAKMAALEKESAAEASLEELKRRSAGES